MTKRLYYDCPIQAAYMAKEFGVKFKEVDDSWDYSKVEGGYRFNNIELSEILTRAIYYNPEYLEEEDFLKKEDLKGMFKQLINSHNRISRENEKVYFSDDEFDSINFENYEEYYESWYNKDSKYFAFFVHEESESIFEAKEGDFVRTFGANEVGVISIRNSQKQDGEIEIIMRDNKHFFTPKQEE